METNANEILTRPIDFEFMPLHEWDQFNARLRQASNLDGLCIAGVAPGELILDDGRRLSVLTLAQLCHMSGHERWDEIINKHLATLCAHVARTPEPFSMLDLRVRLLSDAQADREVLEHLGARPFAEGVVETLAVRLADSVRPVAASEIDELGWDLEDAWRSAWSQTRVLESPEEVNRIDIGGVDILHFFSDEVFGASFVRHLGDVLGADAIGPHGALVSIPVRHSVLVHPIEGADVLYAAQAMIPITRQINRTGPGSVSAHLYWWRDGTLTWIPTYFAPDGMEFFPPEDLIDLIESFDHY